MTTAVAVKLEAVFPGGFRHPPAHPNCRCALVPWRPEWEEPTAAAAPKAKPKASAAAPAPKPPVTTKKAKPTAPPADDLVTVERAAPPVKGEPIPPTRTRAPASPRSSPARY